MNKTTSTSTNLTIEHTYYCEKSEPNKLLILADIFKKARIGQAFYNLRNDLMVITKKENEGKEQAIRNLKDKIKELLAK